MYNVICRKKLEFLLGKNLLKIMEGMKLNMMVIIYFSIICIINV